MMSNQNDETNVNTESPTTSFEPALEAMTLGQTFRKRREEKGLSLKVISQQTKIHIGLLEYLEADQYEKLPSKTYIRGFVKSTSKILGLNIEEMLILLEKAYIDNKSQLPHSSDNKEIKTETARNTLSSMAETPLEAVRSVTMSSTAFVAKFVVGFLILGIIFFNIKNNFEKNKNEVDVELPEVLTTLPKKKAPAPKVVTTPTSTELKTEEPIKINLIEEKNQKVDITLKDVKLENISIGEKQFGPDNLSAEQVEAFLPAKYRVNPTKGVETLFLNAVNGDAWLTYKVDDKEIKKFVLRQGRTLFLRGALIRVFIGNTRSLKAFYNNKPINLSLNAKSGIKNLVLPDELKTKYLAPLFVFLEDGTVETSDVYVQSSQQKKIVPPPVVPAKRKEVVTPVPEAPPVSSPNPI